MPEWVKGNHCWMFASQAWDVDAAETEHFFGINGNVQSASILGQFMAQPGVLRGFNVYVGLNTSGCDIDVKFFRYIFTAPTTYSARQEFTLFTIPAGGTGYFCAPKITTELASRSWARFDRVGIMSDRACDFGIARNWTVGCCLEITEEELLDTQNPPNRAPLF